MNSTCGDDPTGVPGCPEPVAILIEFTSCENEKYVACLCHRHAAGLRNNEDIWGHSAIPEYDDRPWRVTGWRTCD